VTLSSPEGAVFQAPGHTFRLVWAAATLSALGDGIRFVAIPLLATLVTRDPRVLGLITSVGYLAWPVFGLFGGVIADRGDRRQLMWITDSVRAGIVFALAGLVVAQRCSIIWLLVTTFALGAAQTVFDNAAAAILPMMVDDSRLERANSTIFTSQSLMSTLLGAPLGGLLLALAPAAPLLVDGATFAGAAVLVARIKGSYSVPACRARGSVMQDVKAGLHFLRSHSLLRELCALVVVINACFGAAQALLVLYCLEALHLGRVGYGFVLAVFACGGVVGAFGSSSLLRRRGLRWGVVSALLAQAIGLFALGASSNLVITCLALGAVGWGVMVWNVLSVSARQRELPAELLGRVTSAYKVLGFCGLPVGAVAAGAIAKAYGLHTPYLVGSALLVGSAVRFIWATKSAPVGAETPTHGAAACAPATRAAAQAQGSPVASEDRKMADDRYDALADDT
jgi:predicted MFS family arabinose efflux permease